jgi:hypothetical protein
VQQQFDLLATLGHVTRCRLGRRRVVNEVAELDLAYSPSTLARDRRRSLCGRE